MNIEVGDRVESRNGNGHPLGKYWYVTQINELASTATLYPLQDCPGINWVVEVIERPIGSLRKVS